MAYLIQGADIHNLQKRWMPSHRAIFVGHLGLQVLQQFFPSAGLQILPFRTEQHIHILLQPAMARLNRHCLGQEADAL